MKRMLINATQQEELRVALVDGLAGQARVGQANNGAKGREIVRRQRPGLQDQRGHVGG